jgi:hypothetical protein
MGPSSGHKRFLFYLQRQVHQIIVEKPMSNCYSMTRIGFYRSFSPMHSHCIRFDGLYEKPCVAPNDNVKGKERMLIKAIPEHRIQSIKYVTVKLDGEQSINYPTLASS